MFNIEKKIDKKFFSSSCMHTEDEISRDQLLLCILLDSNRSFDDERDILRRPLDNAKRSDPDSEFPPTFPRADQVPLGNRCIRHSSDQQLHRRLLDAGVRVQGSELHRVRLLRVGEHEFWRHVDKGDHRGERVRIQILQDVQTVSGDRVRARSPRGQSRTRSQQFVERVRVQCHVSDDRGCPEFRFLLRPALLLHRQLFRVWRLYVSSTFYLETLLKPFKGILI